MKTTRFASVIRPPAAALPAENARAVVTSEVVTAIAKRIFESRTSPPYDGCAQKRTAALESSAAVLF